jgi:hypothetical protein
MVASCERSCCLPLIRVAGWDFVLVEGAFLRADLTDFTVVASLTLDCSSSSGRVSPSFALNTLFEKVHSSEISQTYNDSCSSKSRAIVAHVRACILSQISGSTPLQHGSSWWPIIQWSAAAVVSLASPTECHRATFFRSFLSFLNDIRTFSRMCSCSFIHSTRFHTRFPLFLPPSHSRITHKMKTKTLHSQS